MGEYQIVQMITGYTNVSRWTISSADNNISQYNNIVGRKHNFLSVRLKPEVPI